MDIALGCIADDFTGATDLANTLVRAGARTIQTIGVPDDGDPVPDADAIVVALKSRTIPAAEAVAASCRALDWLRSRGAGQIFFKYCSTFDSTADGNIGPVADALLDALGADFTIACPAFPTAGRTIYQGYLFVGDVLLSESGMKDHPLTPMRDASLVRLLAAQTPHRVGLVEHATVRRGAVAVAADAEYPAQADDHSGPIFLGHEVFSVEAGVDVLANEKWPHGSVVRDLERAYAKFPVIVPVSAAVEFERVETGRAHGVGRGQHHHCGR